MTQGLTLTSRTYMKLWDQCRQIGKKDDSHRSCWCKRESYLLNICSFFSPYVAQDDLKFLFYFRLPVSGITGVLKFFLVRQWWHRLLGGRGRPITVSSRLAWFGNGGSQFLGGRGRLITVSSRLAWFTEQFQDSQDYTEKKALSYKRF